MKRTAVFVSILVLTFFAVSGFMSCAGAPPPPPPPPPSEETPPRTDPDPAIPPPQQNTDGPEVSVDFSAKYFSPDGDGVDDELVVKIDAKDDDGIAGWHMEIREPYEPYQLFTEWGGQGEPPAQIKWDGRNASGELVQSATEYPYKLTVTDKLGNVSVFEGMIEVDVLVIREADGTLRMRVPSIVFGPNSGDFDGLDKETLSHNDGILRRIAQILNKFGTYRIKVEGHANPIGRTARERQREQETDLILSDMRARYVMEYLVKLGVTRNRLTSFGVGNARPVANINDRNNWWKNRRVEFILEK
jgi:outer membrane protein OmpA-like peptidoglycan-associated protein